MEKDINLKAQNHQQYFQSLEQKLLEQSQKLTNFMGKSLICDKSKAKLKLAVSPLRQSMFKNTRQDDNFNRVNLKNQHNKVQTPYIKKVKELCQRLRNPRTMAEETIRSPQKVFVKEKYDQQRKMAYNIVSFKKQQFKDRRQAEQSQRVARPFIQKPQTQNRIVKEEYQQKVKQQKGKQYVQKIDKSEKVKRFYKFLTDSKSLKDTISTESCKSLKSLGDFCPFVPQERLKLDDFQIIKYLAQGKLGTVYLVRHKASNFLCALKRIPVATVASDPKILTQRIRQIKIQSYLDHPNIVQLYSIFVQDNDLFLLMELCFSGNLLCNLKMEGRFSEDKIRLVIKQVCYGVEFMHDNDILHRDLKPQNILFHQSIAKICDFGWSVNSPLLRDTRCGTPLYSPPQIVQKQQYDNKIDIWNIGILTYQLLYGRVPFEIRTEDDLSKVVDDQIYFPRSMPASPEIKDFILRCLSKNPRERFSITKLIDHQFLNPPLDVEIRSF